jgi:hypothetical protein
MRELDGNKGTSLETYQFWHKEMIYKDGKIALAMDKDGLLKLYFPL